MGILNMNMNVKFQNNDWEFVSRTAWRRTGRSFAFFVKALRTGGGFTYRTRLLQPRPRLPRDRGRGFFVPAVSTRKILSWYVRLKDIQQHFVAPIRLRKRSRALSAMRLPAQPEEAALRNAKVQFAATHIAQHLRQKVERHFKIGTQIDTERLLDELPVSQSPKTRELMRHMLRRKVQPLPSVPLQLRSREDRPHVESNTPIDPNLMSSIIDIMRSTGPAIVSHVSNNNELRDFSMPVPSPLLLTRQSIAPPPASALSEESDTEFGVLGSPMKLSAHGDKSRQQSTRRPKSKQSDVLHYYHHLSAASDRGSNSSRARVPETDDRRRSVGATLLDRRPIVHMGTAQIMMPEPAPQKPQNTVQTPKGTSANRLASSFDATQSHSFFQFAFGNLLAEAGLPSIAVDDGTKSSHNIGSAPPSTERRSGRGGSSKPLTAQATLHDRYGIHSAIQASNLDRINARGLGRGQPIPRNLIRKAVKSAFHEFSADAQRTVTDWIESQIASRLDTPLLATASFVLNADDDGHHDDGLLFLGDGVVSPQQITSERPRSSHAAENICMDEITEIVRSFDALDLAIDNSPDASRRLLEYVGDAYDEIEAKRNAAMQEHPNASENGFQDLYGPHNQYGFNVGDAILPDDYDVVIEKITDLEIRRHVKVRGQANQSMQFLKTSKTPESTSMILPPIVTPPQEPPQPQLLPEPLPNTLAPPTVLPQLVQSSSRLSMTLKVPPPKAVTPAAVTPPAKPGLPGPRLKINEKKRSNKKKRKGAKKRRQAEETAQPAPEPEFQFDPSLGDLIQNSGEPEPEPQPPVSESLEDESDYIRIRDPEPEPRPASEVVVKVEEQRKKPTLKLPMIPRAKPRGVPRQRQLQMMAAEAAGGGEGIDLLSKYCIIHPDRLPMYERIFMDAYERQPCRLFPLLDKYHLIPSASAKLNSDDAAITKLGEKPAEASASGSGSGTGTGPVSASQATEAVETAAETEASEEKAGDSSAETKKKSASPRKKYNTEDPDAIIDFKRVEHILDPHQRARMQTAFNYLEESQLSHGSVPLRPGLSMSEVQLQKMQRVKKALQAKRLEAENMARAITDQQKLATLDVLRESFPDEFDSILLSVGGAKKSKPKTDSKAKRNGRTKSRQQIDAVSQQVEAALRTLRQRDVLLKLYPKILDHFPHKLMTNLHRVPRLIKLQGEYDVATQRALNLRAIMVQVEQEIEVLERLAISDFFSRQRAPNPEEKSRRQSVVYRVTHPERDYEINFDQLDQSLRQINGHLTAQERNFIFSVLDIPSRKRINLRLFSIIAALSERVADIDHFTRQLINKMSLNALDAKMAKCRDFFWNVLMSMLDKEENLGIPPNKLPVSRLAVEFRAGGLSFDEVDHLIGKLDRNRTGFVDFLDVVCYIPLFILLHEKVVENPLYGQFKL